MIIDTFSPFKGQHCETTATGCLLKQLGIEYSEPMLFGLGEGLGFIFWNMKTMDFPFIGGRIKTDLLTENICRNLNLKLDASETSSLKKAWKNVTEKIDKGQAVGLKLDCYHLEYFTTRFHFAGHYVAMYGYDDQFAYLMDTEQQGGTVKTSLESLALARSEKGPMSSMNRSYTISSSGESPGLKNVIITALRNNSHAFLSPPISNLGYKGILKTSVDIKKWFNRSTDVKRDFQTTAMLMERAGTGGSLFRNLYRDFLKESAKILDDKSVFKAYENYAVVAGHWKEVAYLLGLAGESRKVEFINKASKLLVDISLAEKSAMTDILEWTEGKKS